MCVCVVSVMVCAQEDMFLVARGCWTLLELEFQAAVSLLALGIYLMLVLHNRNTFS